MKHRTNWLLAGLVLLSLPLCVWAWLFDIRLMLFLPVLPFFCLQLLLCRVCKKTVFRLLPLLLVAGVALWGLWIWLTTYGWDTLLGLIILSACISPAVGCALGWGVWGAGRLARFCEGRGNPYEKTGGAPRG